MRIRYNAYNNKNHLFYKNRQINDNLEQQAQALFKAWFVDFEPFKDGEFVDDNFVRRPYGWNVKPLEYLVEKVKSGDWGKDEQMGNYTMRTFCMRGADFPDIKEGSKGKMPIRYILEKNFKEKSLCDGNVVVEISGGSPTQSTGRIVLIDKTFIADCDNALICTNFCKSLEIKESFSFPSRLVCCRIQTRKTALFKRVNCIFYHWSISGKQAI